VCLHRSDAFNVRIVATACKLEVPVAALRYPRDK
jgi:hypothetical protein